MTLEKLLKLIMVVILMISLSGCSYIEQIAGFNLEELDSNIEAAEDEIIRLPESEYIKKEVELAMLNPKSLNPLDSNSYSVDQVVKLINEPLFSINQDYLLDSRLGLSYEPLQNKLGRVKLRDDVMFHNGSSFTAEDVLFSLDYIANQEDSPYSYVLDYIDYITIRDEHTIDVRFKANNWFNQYSLSFPIISKSYNESESYKALSPIGTGPYMLEDFQSMVELSLIANPNYYEGTSYMDRVVVTITRSLSDTYNMFSSKRIDIYYPEVTDWSQYSEESSLTINEYVGPVFYYIGLNHQKVIWQSIASKVYLASLIPYESIKDAVFLNHFVPTSLPIPPQYELIESGDSYYYKNNEGSYYSHYIGLDTANSVLNQWTEDDYQWDNPKEMDQYQLEDYMRYLTGYYNAEDPFQVQMVELIDEALKDSLIQVKWDALDRMSYENIDADSEYDVFIGAYQTPIVPNIGELLQSDSSKNLMGYSSLNMDGLLATYLTVDTETQMTNQLENLCKVIADDLPYIPLGYPEEGVFINNQVSGILYPSYYYIYNGFYNINP